MPLTTIVIMAGGRGERLHPLTQHTPKPLLKVGSKPMLESMIAAFHAQGFKHFVLCVHYKAELIEAHFGDGSRFGVDIEYIHEPEPLGTAGALRLLSRPDDPFIVANADVVTRADYIGIMAHHRNEAADATVCLALYQHQVPYGVVETDGTRFLGVQEKPICNYSVAAGIYVLSPHALDWVPPGRSDMPEVVQEIVRRGNVTTYSLTGPWMDVGRFEDYGRAQFGLG